MGAFLSRAHGHLRPEACLAVETGYALASGCLEAEVGFSQSSDQATLWCFESA